MQFAPTIGRCSFAVPWRTLDDERAESSRQRLRQDCNYVHVDKRATSASFDSVCYAGRSSILFHGIRCTTVCLCPLPNNDPSVMTSAHRVHRKPSHSIAQSQSIDLPYLPPEVWGVVIKHACLQDHDPLDASHALSFLEETSAGLEFYRRALVTKLSCSLVCWSWRAYALEFVFEFIWISSASQAKKLAHTLILQSLHQSLVEPQYPGRTYGSHIRRIHIQTPSLERCAPADLLSILELSPGLTIYTDHHSVQRSLYDDGPDPRCSPEKILSLVANPKLRRLSWTSYGDAPFEQRMSPMLTNLAVHLEYLELSSCSPNFRAIFAQPSHLVDMPVFLPSLRALKVSLDNQTFAALASWSMPKLVNLSVLSSDFSYTGPGFSAFFKSHGEKLLQLELGHSSSLVDEHYLTAPHRQHPATPVPLAEWCPRLRQFICSADAEWHWQSPDWIAAHVLLPAHPTVELIGIRDLDARLRDAPLGLSTAPFFTLHELFASLLRRDAFPSLRFVRDMSMASHTMRSFRPTQPVIEFWSRVVDHCTDRHVWLEDCFGINVTQRTLLRANATHRKHF